jgi:hypothetical protein
MGWLARRSVEAAAGGAPPLQGWWRDGGVSFSFDDGSRCWVGDWVATTTRLATASEESGSRSG